VFRGGRDRPERIQQFGGIFQCHSRAKRSVAIFEANKAKLEKQGVNVKEWEQSSKGMKLPERAPRAKSKKSR